MPLNDVLRFLAEESLGPVALWLVGVNGLARPQNSRRGGGRRGLGHRPRPRRWTSRRWTPYTASSDVPRPAASMANRRSPRRGFGKLRLGGDGRGFDPKLQLALAALEWTPRFGWDWSAVVDAGHPAGAGPLVRPLPSLPRLQADAALGPTHFRARIGYFYPPVVAGDRRAGLGLHPTSSRLSAIDSWIGEEVKVGGVEATPLPRLRRPGHRGHRRGVRPWTIRPARCWRFRGWRCTTDVNVRSQAFRQLRTGRRLSPLERPAIA